jgi:hypothetical protein
VRIESSRLKLQSGVTGKIIIVNRGGAKGECGTPSSHEVVGKILNPSRQETNLDRKKNNDIFNAY